ncbi:MAG: GNAT family N-acetyltransferase [Pseudomonadota bacterium]
MITVAQRDALDLVSSEAYRTLFDQAGATPFQLPIWLENFVTTLCPHRGATPFFIAIEDAGELIGTVPLIRRRKSGLTLLETCDLGVSDYAAPVLSPTARTAFADDPSLQTAFKKSLPAHDVLRIRPVRADHSPLWGSLLTSSPIPLGFSAHAVDLAPPFEDWRAAHLDRSFASQARRKKKRWFKQADVRLERLSDPGAIRDAIKRLAHQRAGRFEGDPIQQPAVADFYASVAQEGANPSVALAETWTMTSDGAPVGIVFGLTHRGRFHYLLIGMDYETFGRHSPGLQFYEGLIEDWMNRGGTSFDFTIGDEPFKRNYGCKPTPIVGYLQAGSWKGQAALALLKSRLMGTTGEKQDTEDKRA